MKSLDLCIKKAGKALTSKDADAMRSRLAQFENNPIDAVADYQAELENDSFELTNEILIAAGLPEIKEQAEEVQLTAVEAKVEEKTDAARSEDQTAAATQYGKDKQFVEADDQRREQQQDEAKAAVDEGRVYAPNTAMADAFKKAVDEEAHTAATSPTNELEAPTEAQKSAGNYKKGHVNVQGMDISIENPKGSNREGTSPDGKKWSHKMASHYGYIRRTEGADGDQVDVMLGGNLEAENVFVVDQVAQDGFFDEHKAMVGFTTQRQAVNAYKRNYDKGWVVGEVTEMSVVEFKEWVKTSKAQLPLSEKTNMRPQGLQAEMDLAESKTLTGAKKGTQGEIEIETEKQRLRREGQEFEDRMDPSTPEAETVSTKVPETPSTPEAETVSTKVQPEEKPAKSGFNRVLAKDRTEGIDGPYYKAELNGKEIFMFRDTEQFSHPVWHEMDASGFPVSANGAGGIGNTKAEAEAFLKNKYEVLKMAKARQTKRVQTARKGKTMSVVEINKVYAPMLKEMKALKGNVFVHATLEDAPTEVQNAVEGRGITEAVFHNGKVHIIANRTMNVKDAVGKLLHEGVTHFGLRATMDAPAIRELLADIYVDVRAKPEFEAIAELYEADLSKTNDRLEMTEEYIAYIAESGIDAPILQRVIVAVREWLRSKGLVNIWTDADIKGVLRGVRKDLRRAQRSDGALDKNGNYPGALNVRKDTEVSEPDGEGLTSKQRNLFASDDLSTTDANLQSAANYRVLIKQEKTSEVDIGVDRVKSVEDAAAAFGHVYRHAQENFYVLALDENQRPLSIIRHTQGGTDAASVFPGVVIGALADAGAHSYWMSHNHPSGTTAPSPQDVKLTQNIKTRADKIGLRYEGHIIAGRGGAMASFDIGGSAAATDGDTVYKTEKTTTNKVPITERFYTEDAEGMRPGNIISDPVSAKRIIRQSGLTNGIFFLSNQHEVMAVVPITAEEMGSLRATGDAVRLAQIASQVNANAALIVTEPNPDGTIALNAATFLDAIQIRLLDHVVIEEGITISHAERGILPQPQSTLFAKAENTQARAKGLDMSKKARMSRAKEMGFDTNSVYYHGSPMAGFSSFEEMGLDAEGFYFSESRAHASTYSGSQLEADILEKDEDGDYGYNNEDLTPGVYSVHLKLDNPYEIDFQNYSWDGMNEEGEYDGLMPTIHEVVATAKEQGHDGVIAENIADEGPEGSGYMWGTTTTVIFDPSQIRSTNAAFDPEYGGSGDLLQSRKPALLDMVKAARLKRANEMGFDTNTVYYHGTPDSRGIWEEGFTDPFEEMQGKRDKPFFFSSDKRIASSYADDRRAFDYQGAEPETIATFLKMDNPKRIDWGGKAFRGRDAGGKGFAIDDEIAKAKKEGHDGVIISRVTDDYQAQGFPGNVTVVFKSDQIRSVHAQFDPDYGTSADILQARRPIKTGISLSKEEQDVSIATLVKHGDVIEGGNKNMRAPELGRLLDSRFVDRFGQPLDIDKQQVIQTVSNVTAHEVLAALKSSGNAAEWYADNIREAMEIVAEMHPETKTDPTAMMMFKLALAITSNGTAVPENAANAEKVYQKLKDDGTAQFAEVGFGDRVQAMVKNFQKVNVLLKELGPAATKTFMDKQFTVRELNEMGFDVQGELLDTLVPGSIILGPKIGVFYQNLSGDFDYLTMDLWFMRTWGRVTGTNMRDFNLAFPKRAAKLRGVINELPRMKGWNKRDLMRDDDLLLQYAKERRLKYMREKHTDRSDLNKMSKNLYEAVMQSQIVPRNPGERSFIRQAMGFTKEKLSALGHDLDFATIQALLWYPEKEFYLNHGVGNARSAPTDYATEFRKIADKRPGGKRGSPDAGKGRTTGAARPKTKSKAKLQSDTTKSVTRFALSKDDVAELQNDPSSTRSREIKLGAVVDESINTPPDSGVVKRTYDKASKTVKEAILMASPRRGLKDFANETMTAAKELDRLNNRMDGRQSEYENQVAGIVDRWMKWHSKNKAAGKNLANLMHASTLVGQDPSKAFEQKADVETLRATMQEIQTDQRTKGSTLAMDNKVARLQSQIEAENKRKQQYLYVRKAFDKLTGANPEAGEIFNQVRDQNDQTYNLTMKMLMKRIEDSGIEPDVKKKTKEMLRLKFESGKVEGPYFTLGRFGNYWGAAKRGDEVVSFSKFETREQMTEWVAEWNKEEGIEANGSEDMQADLGASSKHIDPNFVKQVENLLGEKGINTAIKDEIWQMYLSTLPEMSARKSFMHRKGRMGFSQDALRSFTGHQFKASHMLAKLEYVHRIEDKLRELETQTSTAAGTDAWAAPTFDEIKRRHDYAMNPSEADWAVKFTSFGFHWYLGFNPSTALVNLSQTWILGVPVLGAAEGGALGPAKAAKALALASFDAPFAENRGKLTEDEAKAFKEFRTINLFEKTRSADLSGLSQRGTEYLSPTRKMSEYSAKMFHVAEVFNREVTALAAYRMSRKRGNTHEQAILDAEDITWDTHFDYSNVNRPRVMQQGVGRVIFLFKNYSANIGYRLGRDTVDGLKGKDRAAALTRLVGVLGTTALASGAKGLPIWWAIYGIALAMEDDDEPLHVEGSIRSYLTEVGGKDFSHLVMDGGIDSMTGLSVSQRVSLSSLFIRNTEKAMEGNEAVLHYTQELLGPIFGALINNAGMAAYDYSRGNDELAAERLTPTIVKGWLQSNRMAAEGLRNRSDEQILDKEEFDDWDKWKRRSGFSLDKVAQAYKRNEVAYVLDEKLEQRKAKLTARWVNATQRGQTGKVHQIEAQIKIFNSKRSRYRDKVSNARLNSALRNRKTNVRRSVGGVGKRVAERAEASGQQNF